MAADDRGEVDRLRKLWIPTLGDTAADPEWRALPPGSTYKPAGTTELDLPSASPDARPDATLSGVGTLGGTLSGRETAAGSTLSGRGTSGGDPPLADRKPRADFVHSGFELTGEVGRGGMGIVFRARQRSLARDIAIKLVRPEAAQATTRSQFVSEALVNGLLDHPNIVPVHELGTTEEGEVFLAMKLVGGTSWKNLLHPSGAHEQKLAAEYDLDRHLAVLQSVGNALAFAHSKGIVHRDLKPENVMVGDFGEVLVMDWGIAVDVRELPGKDARARHKSTIRAPSGTPSYMPPELAEGRGSDIGPWTDTYLLGAILHELLTGQPPHRGATLLGVLLAASQSAAPVFAPGTPPGLAAICTKSLARSPKERFATVAEFQSALRDYVKHRESEKIAEVASLALGRAGAGGQSSKTQRYGDYAEALAGFRQALALWDANTAAREGEGRARREYAQAALAAGDLGLAEEQARTLENGDELRGRIAAERAAVASRLRAARRNRLLLATAACVIVVGSVVAALWINSERGKAVSAQRTAENEKTRAEKANQESRRQLVVAMHRQAVQAQERGEDSTATVLFARALELSETDGVRDSRRRIALQNSLSHLPPLETVFALDGEPEFCMEGGRRLVVAGPRGIRVWDGMDAKPLSDWIALTAGYWTPILSDRRHYAWFIDNQFNNYDSGRVFDVVQAQWAGPNVSLGRGESLLDLGDDGSLFVLIGEHGFQRRAADNTPLAGEFVLAPGEGEESWTVRLAQLSPNGKLAVVVQAHAPTQDEGEFLFRMTVVSTEDGHVVCEAPARRNQPRGVDEREIVPRQVLWSPDGKLVASLSAGRAIAWSAADGSQDVQLQALGDDPGSFIKEVHWLSNEMYCGFDELHHLRFPPWTGMNEIAPTESVRPASLSFAGTSAFGRGVVALGANERELQVWVLGQRARPVCAPISLSQSPSFAAIEPVEAADGTPRMRVLAVGSDGIAKIALVDPRANRDLPMRTVAAMKSPSRQPRSRAQPETGDLLAPDGGHVVFRKVIDGPLWIAPLTDPDRALELPDTLGVLAWSSRIDRVACSTRTGARLFEFPAGRPLAGEVVSPANAASCAFEHTNRMLVCFTSSSGEEQTLFDLESGARVEDSVALEFAKLLAGQHDRSTTPGNAWSVSGYDDSVIVVTPTRSRPRVFACIEMVEGTSISIDGKQFLTRSQSGVVRVLSTETGRELFAPLCEGDPIVEADWRAVFSAHFSPDASIVATTDQVGVRLWDLAESLPFARLRFHGAVEASVTNDLHLVVAYRAQAWDLGEDGLVIARIPGFEGDPAELQRSLAVRLDREWNGTSVQRLDWRDVLERALKLTEAGAGFKILHIAQPSQDSWQAGKFAFAGER